MFNFDHFFVSTISLLLVISGLISAEEATLDATKNGTAAVDGGNSTSSKDSPALISLHPSSFRESQLSTSLPPPPPPRYSQRPPPKPHSHPHPRPYYSHNPHQYHHNHHHHHSSPHYDDPYHHHYHPYPHHHHHSSPSPYYRPPPPSLLPALDPAQLGDLVGGFGQAFTNFLSQRVRAAPAAQSRLLNGEHNLLATASQLLPAAANRLLSGLQQLQQQPNFGIQSRLSTFSPRLTQSSPKPPSANETSASSDSDGQQPSAAASSDHQTMVSSPEFSPPLPPISPQLPPINYEEEGRKLREDIIAKVGHLQNILTTALEVSKERRDILTRRLLEQTNYRLEQAKARADRILSEPQNAQMVLRALQTVNQGVSGITAFLQALFERINLKMNETPPNFSTETPKLENTSNGTSTTTSKPE